MHKDEELEHLIGQIWQQDVIQSINDVLDADHYLGFKHFEVYADPSIEDITRSIGIIEAALTTFLSSGKLSAVSEEILLNCQQCVHLIRRVFSALKRKDHDEYTDAVGKLKCHSRYKKEAA